MRTMTSVDAQNRFGELLDSAQREPVTITRRGRPVAIVVSQQDMRDLLAARQGREFASAAFERFFADADAQLSPAVASLSDEAVTGLVNELR